MEDKKLGKMSIELGVKTDELDRKLYEFAVLCAGIKECIDKYLGDDKNKFAKLEKRLNKMVEDNAQANSIIREMQYKIAEVNKTVEVNKDVAAITLKDGVHIEGYRSLIIGRIVGVSKESIVVDCSDSCQSKVISIFNKDIAEIEKY